MRDKLTYTLGATPRPASLQRVSSRRWAESMGLRATVDRESWILTAHLRQNSRPLVALDALLVRFPEGRGIVVGNLIYRPIKGNGKRIPIFLDAGRL